MKLYETITAENWKKGGIGVGPTHCLVGHLIYSEADPSVVMPIHQAIRTLYPERVEGSRIMVAFNDHPDTTFEDVQRVLKFADV